MAKKPTLVCGEARLAVGQVLQSLRGNSQDRRSRGLQKALSGKVPLSLVDANAVLGQSPETVSYSRAGAGFEAARAPKLT